MTSTPSYRRSAILATVLATIACGPVRSLAAQLATPVARAQQPAPRLIVMITVDQLLPQYFDRFATQLTGGLGRLAREGAMFTRAHQDHAITETAPGHASTLSGRFPASTGIVMNSAGVGDAQAPLVQAEGPGASPYRFRGTTLTDWLRFKDSRTRALSVSRKDRGAILPLGRATQDVYWYVLNGKFTTSTYYRDTLPDWVRQFNERNRPSTYAGRSWTLLLPPESYPEADSVAVESGGRDFLFPHVAPGDSVQAARLLPEFPWMDDLTLDLALAGVTQLRLGSGPQTDVLAVSLSTTDAVGHRYGPDSREIHDQILRLDRAVGRFLDSLLVLRSREHVAIALTSDHGVAPFPELAARHSRPVSIRVDLAPLVRRTADALVARGVDSTAFRVQEGMVLIDRAAFANARVNADSAVNAFLVSVRQTPGVLRTDRLSTLRARNDVNDAIGRRWLHMIPNESDAVAVITLKPFNPGGRVTYAQHGSPHDYDTHVPLLLFGPWFTPGKYTSMVRVVDIAPTLAWIARTKPTERLDGRVLRAALK